MANEIQESIFFKATKGFQDIIFSPASRTATWTGTDSIAQTYQLDTSYAAIGKGAITNLGVCIIHNLNALAGTNVLVSLDGGTTDHFLLEPGEWIRVRFVTGYTIANCQLKASATTALARVILLEA